MMDIEEESVGVKKACPTRGVKRSRSAEVHNLSERRRRDRINEKMRALQDLIPNCNKVRLFILSNLEPYLLLLEPKMQPEKQRNETKRQEACVLLDNVCMKRPKSSTICSLLQHVLLLNPKP
ncbi:hypothetical protein HN51_007115 [Arachis hypogaea]|uniref:transcription factor APG isoform X1 n=1 Tax=Arachis hypogaea TaxID=3818 RepID=UPI000DECA317|nr:transcription factor PIF3 isoform X2 [Arachis hypogaea]QHO41169.1 Transcription factor [Arachis hypogaea]